MLANTDRQASMDIASDGEAEVVEHIDAAPVESPSAVSFNPAATMTTEAGADEERPLPPVTNTRLRSSSANALYRHKTTDEGPSWDVGDMYGSMKIWGGGGSIFSEAYRQKSDEMRLREVFEEIDTDGSGTLDRDELAQLVMLSKGGEVSGFEADESLSKVMAELTDDGASNEVDFERFYSWYTQQPDDSNDFKKLVASRAQFSPLRTLRAPMAAVAVEYCGMSMVVPILAWFVVDQHGGEVAWVGIIMSCQYGAGILGQVLGGYISDRIGVRNTIALIMLADIITFGATGFAQSIHQMLAIRTLAGLFNPSAAASAWIIKATTESQRPKAYGVYAFCRSATSILGSAITGPLFLLGGLPFVGIGAAVMAAVGFVVALFATEPQKQIKKRAFPWADVRGVMATREWLYMAGSYFTMGMMIGFTLLFVNVLLVYKYAMPPEGVSALLIPILVTSLISSVFIGPKLLSKYGPRPILKYSILLAGISELVKINFRGEDGFDEFYLVFSITMTAVTVGLATTQAPTLATLLPRAIVTYGSEDVVGTVSGLTRIGMAIGQSIGPILSASLFTVEEDYLILHFGVTGVLFLGLGTFAQVVIQTRPDFVAPLVRDAEDEETSPRAKATPAAMVQQLRESQMNQSRDSQREDQLPDLPKILEGETDSDE